MDHLPKDPFMLVSSINMLLRDNEFDSLEDLCNYFDRELTEIQELLLTHGFVYHESLRQFRQTSDDA